MELHETSDTGKRAPFSPTGTKSGDSRMLDVNIPAGSATFGTKTASVTALEAGGVGLIGWLSQIWRDIKALKLAAAAAAAYRATVTAADFLAVPGTVTCTKQAGGSCAAGVYSISVIAGNSYGRTTPVNGNVQITTETTNLTCRAAFAQVAGAGFYDVYCSIAAAGAGLWVGRISEAQRAAGCVISEVNVVGAGSIAGAVDIQVTGTGLAANLVAQNTAWAIPAAAAVDCTGYQYVDFDVSMSRTGDIAAPALKLVPFFYDSADQAYNAGDMIVLSFGGTSGSYAPNRQRVRIESRGCSAVHLLVASIAGTGASVNMNAVVS